jgi:hypothetical protein
MTYVKMVKCIRISVIDIGVKSPKAGIAHPSGVPKFILGFSGVSVVYLQFVLFSISLFVFLSVFFGLLRFTDSDYPFGIFNCSSSF